MDIKSWLEDATGLKAEENMYITPPPLPYLIYLVTTNTRGADDKNNIKEHDTAVELYDKTVSKKAEEKIEKLLDDSKIQYSKDRTYLHSEKKFMTIYSFKIIEKGEKIK